MLLNIIKKYEISNNVIALINIVLAKGSLRFILPPLGLGVFLHIIDYLTIALIFYGIALYMIWFFRDPQRKIIRDDTILYAAADGKIKDIISEQEATKVAIRMSPFDVHLNRTPSDGEVTRIKYKPGAHTNVYFGDPEESNEQNLISIRNKDLMLDILQITGMFARRLECWVDVGQEVEQGQRIGIIRFGSQTNMLITPDNPDRLEIIPQVSIGQQVHAGITPIVKIRRLSQ